MYFVKQVSRGKGLVRVRSEYCRGNKTVHQDIKLGKLQGKIVDCSMLLSSFVWGKEIGLFRWAFNLSDIAQSCEMKSRGTITNVDLRWNSCAYSVGRVYEYRHIPRLSSSRKHQQIEPQQTIPTSKNSLLWCLLRSGGHREPPGPACNCLGHGDWALCLVPPAPVNRPGRAL